MNIENFTKQFENCYSSATNGEKLEIIKTPVISKIEDGSILVEWIFPKFRIGFSFEKPNKERFFYIVAKQDLKSLMHSETFKNKSELGIAIRTAVNYIIENKDR